MSSEERLVILSGPSCVGKSPLCSALGKFYPEIDSKLRKLVLVNSRNPRPGEVDGVDYHFRTREQVEALRADSRYAVLEARSDLQALNVEELKLSLENGDVLFEGNPYVGRALQTHPQLNEVKKLSVFVSPLSREEVEYLKGRKVSLPEFVADVQRRKLLRRMTYQKHILSARDLEEIEVRCGAAYREMREACRFDHVIVNHDGEDSEHWDAFYYPVGDARKTLESFAALLRGEAPAGVEKWEEGLV
jgi:guanylate kinase